MKRGGLIFLVVTSLGAAMALLSHYFFSIAVRLQLAAREIFSNKNSLLG